MCECYEDQNIMVRKRVVIAVWSCDKVYGMTFYTYLCTVTKRTHVVDHMRPLCRRRGLLGHQPQRCMNYRQHQHDKQPFPSESLQLKTKSSPYPIKNNQRSRLNQFFGQ